MPDYSIIESVSRLHSAVVCGRCGRRIEGEQHIRHTNVTTPSVSPYEKMASPERDEPRSLRMMASIDVRKARHLYQRSRYWRCRIFPLTRVYRASNPPLCVVVVVGGLRGSNISVTPMSQPPQYTASPVQTSRPTKRWLRRNGTSRVPYKRWLCWNGRSTS